MKRGQVTQFIIAGLVILILLIGGNVNADFEDCKKTTDLAEQGAENNMKGYNKIKKPEPLVLLPEKLKGNVKDVKIDDLGSNFNVEYLGDKEKSIAIIQSTIREKRNKITIDLNYIWVAPEYRGTTGTELFNNFRLNTKIRNNMAEGILRGQADDFKILNYWSSLGAKLPRDSYRKTIEISGKKRLMVAVKDRDGMYKYYNEITNKEEILKNSAGWQFIKGEKPKDIPVYDTPKAFWFEF